MVKKALNPIGNLSVYLLFSVAALYACGVGRFVITLKGSFPVML